MAEANWYWAQGDQRNGPVVGGAIARLVADGKLGAEDLIWKEGMAVWIPIRKVPALAKYLNRPSETPQITPEPPDQQPATQKASLQDSPLVAQQAPAAVLAYQSGPVDQRSIHQFARDPNAAVNCPHCSVGNTTDAQWCESCGMALPIPSAGPRIVDGDGFASSAAGQQLQSDELHKQSKKAATALMWVAIIQTIVAAFWISITASNPRMLPITQQPVALSLIVTGAIFWGLFFWARVQPLPAAIVGLVLYSTLKVISFVVIISQAGGNGAQQFNGGIANSGIGWLDIVIIVVLAQAISAGLKYRKMQGNAGEVSSVADG